MSDQYFFIGIELGYKFAEVSVYQDNFSDVETVSTSREVQKYEIPTAIFFTESGKYFYGDEARKRCNRPDGSYYENLYQNALREKEDFTCTNMLCRFLNRLIHLGDPFKPAHSITILALSVPSINADTVFLYRNIQSQIECGAENILLLDYNESFYAHTYHQDPSIWLHDVVLFHFSVNEISMSLLHRSGSGKLSKVSYESRNWLVPETVLSIPERKDEFFANVIRETFHKKIITGVYLTGDGFDGDWLNESIRVIGSHKRVFLGNNLYTRGACYAAYRSVNSHYWPLYFDCDYKMKGGLDIFLETSSKTEAITLVTAGNNWFQETKTIFMIYNGNQDIRFEISDPIHHESRSYSLTLEDIPKRPQKTIRLQLICEPVSANLVQITIQDDGFGELYPSSGKTWNFTIEI